MSLVTEQDMFLKDIVKLLERAYALGFQVTAGEAYRTIEQQKIYVAKGLSKTMNSQHLRRLAMDLQFFKEGKWIQAKKDLQELGDYWEALDRKNRWGGNFTSFLDTPHFERYH